MCDSASSPFVFQSDWDNTQISQTSPPVLKPIKRARKAKVISNLPKVAFKVQANTRQRGAGGRFIKGQTVPSILANMGKTVRTRKRSRKTKS